MARLRPTNLHALLSTVVIAGCLAWPPGHANAQSVSVAWDRPGGPAEKDFTAGPVDLYVTVQGLSVPVKAMQVFVKITTEFFCPIRIDPLPDAWSFAPDGCQAGRACFAAGNFGELMRDAHGVPLRITDLARDSFLGTERAVLAEVYRDPFVPDPAATYPLLRLRFDHTFTVNDTIAPPGSCADRNRTIFLAITRASWLDVDQVEHQFPVGREFVIWNPDGKSQVRNVVACNPADETPSLLAGTLSPASTLPACEVPVPAERATWGRLKSAYR